MKYLIPILLLIIGLCAQNPDHWHSQIMLGEMAVVFYIALELYKRVHLSLALSFLYFGVYGVYCAFYTWPVSIPNFNIQMYFNETTARSLVFLLCATVPFIFAEKIDLLDWFSGFKAFAVLNAILMIGNRIFTGAATGMIGMDSIDGSFLAILLPAFFRSRWQVITLLLIAMALAKSSTVFGVLVLYVMTILYWHTKRNAKYVFFLVLAIIVTVPIGRLYLSSQLFDDSGRFHVLGKTLALFERIAKLEPNLYQIKQHLVGLGTGSFLVLTPFFQGTTHSFFVFLHNEPVQVFFEQGIVGVLLLTTVFYFAIQRQRKNIPHLLMILGAGLQSFIQPCFRYFLFALFMAFLTRLSFEEETSTFFKKGEIL